MSSLTDVEKRYIENLLNMKTGYVLDYTDATFGEFFEHHGVNIHSQKYQKYGTSKAKKLRAFWEQESDQLVSRVLAEMLDVYETNCELKGGEVNATVLQRARDAIARLSGGQYRRWTDSTRDHFLSHEFVIPDLCKLPLESAVVDIIEARLDEARRALDASAHLAVVLLCGSVLECVLLGAARKSPEQFNRSKCSPRNDDGRVKPFRDWSLAQFIDVAHDIGLLELDVKKFGHGLRDFRNFIHPYEQLESGFVPDEHTAKVCFQVLKAALASVAGER